MSISLCLRGSARHRGLATVRLCSTLPRRSSPLARGCVSTRGRGTPFCTPRNDESALYPVVNGSTSFYAHYSTAIEDGCLSGKGIVVGCYDTEDGEGGYELTECAKDIDFQTKGKLIHLINMSGGRIKKGDSRLFYDITEDHAHIAAVGLGPRSEDVHENMTATEDMNVTRQTIRSAAAVGTKLLQSAQVADILLDDFSDPEACAEGSTLSLFSFDRLKEEKKRKKIPNTSLLSTNPAHSDKWKKGCVLAEAQNFARDLMESPANHMTPTKFVEAVSNRLGGVRLGLTNPGALQIIPRPLSWIQSKEMGAFLSIAQGSSEEPWLLEIRYNWKGKEDTRPEKPTVLVGKGVTFDTGGVSIKPSAGMELMRGDMGGAACVVATVMAIAQLECPTSVVGLVPLCENMVSGCAVKPGDVVRAMNGKTIQVDNTDAEGRLLLADTLCYSQSFNPSTIIDLATLTGAIDVALGSGAAAVFTTSTSLWQQLHLAGHVTGDRVWRMPLYHQYSKQIEAHLADISNIGTRGRSAGACTAAAFLKEFVEIERWAHLDIAGVMESHGELPFLNKGMTGRPTRTLIQYLLSNTSR